MHVRLIDANSVGYAQHHAGTVTHAGNMQTQGFTGFLAHIRKQIQFTPDILNVVIWDGRAQWRYDLHPGYKAGRHRTAEQRAARQAYEEQRPWIQRALAYFPVVQIRHPGAEADDVAFGLSKQVALQGNRTSVYSADFDWLQMVTRLTSWVNARKPSTHVVELGNFAAESGGYLRPDAVAQLKALTGDVSDDIPGMVDVGLKRAGSLLSKYGSFESILTASEDFMGFSSEPKHFHSLMTPEVNQLVRRNLKLVDLAKGPPLLGADLEVTVGDFCDAELFSIFIDMDFQQGQSYFDNWARVLSTPPNTGEVQYIKRAAGQIAGSWPGDECR